MGDEQEQPQDERQKILGHGLSVVVGGQNDMQYVYLILFDMAIDERCADMQDAFRFLSRSRFIHLICGQDQD